MRIISHSSKKQRGQFLVVLSSQFYLLGLFRIIADHIIQRFQLGTAFQKYLSERGIQTVIHYPIPPHLAECYQYLGHKAGDYPVAEHMAKTVLSLPMFNGMREDEVQYVIETVNGYVK